ncbi:post-GPI attachment to proteins factor 2-like isoform X2 [Lytechinus variegatus]|uniref:post-GPI attachment to proteins factor 2-like isoform X2 n=1 Tax=Lytechinus variegatus TaxID=7654 RepID=UPI001BB25E29|nr:post-GPI attachment to proteins factor 2-like isoform X2 [Lytechinus variegatus]
MDTDRRYSSNGLLLSVRTVGRVTAGIMCVGFLLSVACAIIFNFEITTRTHCGVSNYLPSISAAIAEPPSCYLWRLAVTLCSAQRVFFTLVHYNMYSSILVNKAQYQWLCKLCFFLELTENLGLIGLTCVSSVENHKAHEYFFIVFQTCALLYMMILCMIHRLAITQGPVPTSQEYKTFMRKFTLFITNLVAFISALYFFYRHNRYCEPGVYTIFAFLEYVVVMSNILFHFMVTNNFKEREMKVGSRAGSRLKMK